MDSPFPVGMVEEIEKFLANDSTRQPGLDSYKEVFATNYFFPLQRRKELERMIRIAKNAGSSGPKVVFEIGSDKGGGFYHWCKCLPTVERAVACEIRGTPYAQSFEKAFPHIKFCWVEGSSYEAREYAQVSDFLFKPEGNGDYQRRKDYIDVLFIDGDKGEFLKDFALYQPLMSPRGVIFMHDVSDGEPRRAFTHVAQMGSYRTEVIVDRSESLEAEKREEQGIPVDCPYEGWLRYWRGRSCTVGVIYMPEYGK